jgi:hypothetical protein
LLVGGLILSAWYCRYHWYWLTMQKMTSMYTSASGAMGISTTSSFASPKGMLSCNRCLGGTSYW